MMVVKKVEMMAQMMADMKVAWTAESLVSTKVEMMVLQMVG